MQEGIRAIFLSLLLLGTTKSVNQDKGNDNQQINRSCGIEESDKIKIVNHIIESSIFEDKYIASVAKANE